MTARVIVGGVGYPDLCDYSIGIDVQERLSAWNAPPNVSVEDLSYNPIAIVQRLNDESAEQRFGRMIVVSAVKRDRAPGTVSCYVWDGALPSNEEVQDAVTDAVTGIIALENTLVIAQYFGALPSEVIVVEIEPKANDFGAALSEPVRLIFDYVCETVKTLATDDIAVAQLPVQPLVFAMVPGTRMVMIEEVRTAP